MKYVEHRAERDATASPNGETNAPVNGPTPSAATARKWHRRWRLPVVLVVTVLVMTLAGATLASGDRQHQRWGWRFEPAVSSTTVAPTTTVPASTTSTSTATTAPPPVRTTSTTATTTPSMSTTIMSQPTTPTRSAGFWAPTPKAPWQWQLTTPIDVSVEVPVFDIDLFDNPKSVIDGLHAKGRKVICYMDAGAWESYRPDASRFPASVIGNSTGWNGERWLDIRQVDVIGPIIAARLDLAVSKGCDAVEPDQNNGWENNPGFPITREQSIAWNIWVADAAHRRGLSVGLKNSIGETAVLEPHFDWALNEECFQYNECGLLSPFTKAGKPVLQVEYKTDPSLFCPRARELGFSSMKKNLDLDAPRTPC